MKNDLVWYLTCLYKIRPQTRSIVFDYVRYGVPVVLDYTREKRFLL